MMTNAEKIRSMSDEELETCLAKLLSRGIEWFFSRSCNLCQAKHGGECPTGESDTCLVEDGDILDWLKEEAENS